MKPLLTIFTLSFSILMFSQPSTAGVRFVILETTFNSNSSKIRVVQRGNNSFQSKNECEEVMRQKYLFDGYVIEKRNNNYGTPDLIFKQYSIRSNYFSGTEISCTPILGDWNIKDKK